MGNNAEINNDDNLEGINQISIASNERLFSAGKTGSGKSFLTTRMMKGINRLIFIDPKHEHKFDEATVFKDFYSAANWILGHRKTKNFFIHIKPPDPMEADVNHFCKAVFSVGNMTVVFDEVGEFCYPRAAKWHRQLMRQGRARGIGCWNLSQRPAYIDMYLISEAEHKVIFQLTTQKDRERISGMIDVDKDTLKSQLRKLYHFYYDHTNKGCMFCSPISP